MKIIQQNIVFIDLVISKNYSNIFVVIILMVRCSKFKNAAKVEPLILLHGWIELTELITNITFKTFFGRVLAEKSSKYEKPLKK